MTVAELLNSNSVMDFFISRLPEPRDLMKLANWSGIAFFWVTSIVVTTTCTFIIIPTIWASGDGDDSTTGAKPVTWILLFFAANMILNYLRCLLVSPYYDAGKLNVPSAEGGKNWGYCVPCQQYIPPRAHHCPVCVRCCLKRESHCFFIGRCVGHANQRFFIVYCFYTALASLYAFLCYGTFLHREIGPILSWHMPEYLLPYASFRLLMGTFTPLGAVALFLFYTTMMTGVGCALLFFHQINLVLQGQTSFEVARRTNEYDAGAQVNLREVFGPYWWLCFLLPVKFQLPVDGISWNRLKNIKNY